MLRWSFAFALSALAACAPLPPPEPVDLLVTAPVITSDPAPPAPSAVDPDTQAGAFDFLPGWQRADLDPARQAMARTCAQWAEREDASLVSNRAPYAGRVEDWRAACAALEVATDTESTRLVFEALFTPVMIAPAGETPRFTGYFEPQIEARRRPVWPYTFPIPGLPDDLVQVDGSVFGRTGGVDVPAQRLADGRLRPYPARADIVPDPRKVLGYAHPGDVFFLQIQGSGRLRFEDGSVMRAAYGAHNGQPFRSTANWLINSGRITRGEASMQGIRAWMERSSPAEVQAAMNANPRYVFFLPRPIGDPTLGPVGAHNLPLTPLGSVAVDTSIHALGTPMFVETTAPGLGGDWSGLLIAQDTGGAITGPVRGDIYFGTGDAAGEAAGTMNAPGRMWALLPHAVAARLTMEAGAD